MSNKLPITVWYRDQHDDKGFQFNHISDGFNPSATEPIAVSKEQKTVWKGAFWDKEEAYLQDGCVKRVDAGSRSWLIRLRNRRAGVDGVKNEQTKHK